MGWFVGMFRISFNNFTLLLMCLKDGQSFTLELSVLNKWLFGSPPDLHRPPE